MWPLLLDLTLDESKRILRRLELEAYSSLVSAFRAQGILTKYKKKLLQELQHALSISTERHRAEVRRAVNDEQLSSIADNMSGPSTDADWLIEGRRLIPLMPRLVPQTAFTVTANQAVNTQVGKNAVMPSPAQTGNKDWGTILDEEEEIFAKKRRHNTADSISSVSAGTQTSRATTSSSSNNLHGISPVKITISKNSQTRNQNTNAVATQTQKVILVSTSGSGSNGGANVLPKSISLPLVKAIPTTSVSGTGSGHPKMSIVMPNTNSTPAGITISNGNLGNIITVVTTSNTSLRSTSTNTTAVLGTSSTAFLPSSLNIPKNRPKSVQKQKVPQLGQKPGVVIPIGAQSSSHNSPGNMSVQGIQIKPAKSAIQIKHEGGMKIITQSIPAPGSKILPKPTPSGTPVVVVSGVSTNTTASTVSMVTRPVSTISGETVKRALGIQVSQAGNSKILNINTQGGKVITTTTKNVNPKTLHLTAVKSAAAAAGAASRPNVIVVTKAPPKRPGIPLVTGISKGTSTVLPSSFEKELVSFIQKQDIRNNPGNISALKSPLEKKIIVTTTVPEAFKSRHPQAQITEVDSTGKTSSLLAELIQAAGILPDHLSSESVNAVAAAASSAISVSDVAITSDDPVEVIQGSNAFPSSIVQNKLTAQALQSNEWFEYDVTDDQPQSYSTDSNDAITALLEIQQQPNSSNIQLKEKDIPISSGALELANLTEPQHFYTIEQAMNILSQEEKESVASINSSAESLDGFLTPSAIPISLSKQLNEQIQVIASATSSTSDTTTTTTATTTTTTTTTAAAAPTILNQITCTTTKGTSGAKIVSFTNQDSNMKKNSVSAPLSFALSSTTTASSLSSSPSSSSSLLLSSTSSSLSSSSSTSSKVLDLLSSSLEQAQIDLHTYQFIEGIDNFNEKTIVQTVPIHSNESVIQTVPIHSNEPMLQTVSIKSNEPVLSPAPINSNEPVVSTAPITDNEPVVPTVAIKINEPVPTIHMKNNEPVVPSIPIKSKESIVSIDSLKSNEPVVPIKSKESIVPPVPKKNKESIVLAVPIKSNEPVIPIKSKESIVPMKTKEPVVVTVPMKSKEPVVVTVPIKSKEPVVATVPIKSKELGVAAVPIKSKEPAVATVSIKSKEPVVATLPLKSKEPVIVTLPIKSKEPVVATFPIKSKERIPNLTIKSKEHVVTAPFKCKESAAVTTSIKIKESATVTTPIKSKESAAVPTLIKIKEPVVVTPSIKSKESVISTPPIKSKESDILTPPIKSKESDIAIPPIKIKEPIIVTTPIKSKECVIGIPPIKSKESVVIPPIKSKEPVVANVPIKSKEPVVANAPIKSKEPVVANAPIKSKEPVVANAPIKSKEPVVANAPIKSKEPVVANAPIKSKEPVVATTLIKSKEPVVATTLIKSKEPVVTTALIKSKEPVITTTPIKSKEFVIATSLIKSKESVVATTPIKSKEPVIATTPIKIKEPVIATTIKSKEPIILTAPIKSKEPVIVTAPIKSKEPVVVTAPIKSKETVVVTAPIKSKEPVVVTAPIKSKEPVIMTAPIKTKEPVIMTVPIKSKELVFPTASIKSKESIIVTTPIKSKEPVVTTSIKSNEPVLATTPIKSKEPVVAAAPIKSKEPIVLTLPIKIKEPVVQAVPLKIKEPVVQTVSIKIKEPVILPGSNVESATASASLLPTPPKKALTQQLNSLEEKAQHPKTETGSKLDNEKILTQKVNVPVQLSSSTSNTSLVSAMTSINNTDNNRPVHMDKTSCSNLETKTAILVDYVETHEEVVVTESKPLTAKIVETPLNTAPSLTAEVDNVSPEINPKKINTKVGLSLHLSTHPEIISVDANSDNNNTAYQKKDVELNSDALDQLNVKNVDFLCKESLDEISLGSPGTELGSSSDSQGDGSYCGDLNPVRVSQRKRKPPASLDDNPSPSSRGGWVRIALSLLERVSRYRGANREKRELNAASWFNRPVDPLEAPDYYTIVKTPMDFSRIRKNLESGHYGTLEDFHNDMLLVRSNCNLYNPMQSSVQKDCEEVFTFYIQEYEKMVDKWKKSRIPYAQPHSASVAKKIKTDKNAKS